MNSSWPDNRRGANRSRKWTVESVNAPRLCVNRTAACHNDQGSDLVGVKHNVEVWSSSSSKTTFLFTYTTLPDSRWALLYRTYLQLNSECVEWGKKKPFGDNIFSPSFPSLHMLYILYLNVSLLSPSSFFFLFESSHINSINTITTYYVWSYDPVQWNDNI